MAAEEQKNEKNHSIDFSRRLSRSAATPAQF